MTVPGPFIVIIVVSDDVLAIVIVAGAFHDEKMYPELLGTAEMGISVAPLSYHKSTLGVVVPAPVGLTVKETRYCSVQLQVMLDGAFRMIFRVVSVPEFGTLPVPIYPIQLYLTPPDSSAIAVTERGTCEPVSNQFSPVLGRDES